MKIALLQMDMSIVGHGIRYLSSYIKQYGHSTRLIFMGGKTRFYRGSFTADELLKLEKIVDDCDVIGVSTMVRNVHRTIEVVNYLKKLNKPIIWGGVFATTNPEYCLKHCDIICIGEGELALKEYLDCLEKGSNCYNIQNFWFKKDDKIIKNSIRPILQELDKLPFQDYSNDDHWVLYRGYFIDALTYYDKYHDGRLGIMGSRGCPNNCTYCCAAFLREKFYNNVKPVRNRSFENIIEEIEDIITRIPFFRLVLFDDSDFFMRSLDELNNFRDLYNEKIKLPFWPTGSPLTIKEDKLKCLMECGLDQQAMGIQTGSDDINYRIYKRKMPHERTLETAEMMHRVLYNKKSKYGTGDIDIINEFIVMNPWEKNEDLLKSIELIQRLPYPNHIGLSPLMIFPGTRLHELGVADGFVTKEIDDTALINGTFYEHWNCNKKNIKLYLNSILWWCQGKVTEKYIGILPRLLLKTLIRPKMIVFFDRMPILVHILNHIYFLIIKLKNSWRELLKKILFSIFGERKSRQIFTKIRNILGTFSKK